MKDKAIQEFVHFCHQPNDDSCLDITEKRDTLSDKIIIQLVSKKYHLESAALSNTKPETKINVLKYLKELEGHSLRQLARLTGLMVNLIVRV